MPRSVDGEYAQGCIKYGAKMIGGGNEKADLSGMAPECESTLHGFPALCSDPRRRIHSNRTHHPFILVFQEMAVIDKRAHYVRVAEIHPQVNAGISRRDAVQ